MTSNPGIDIVATKRSLRGELTIFLGAVPGVGKTLSMLENARLKQRDGTDILFDVMNESARLIELDVEAILARHPKIVVIEGLARTNPTHAMRSKRHMDVEAILAAGISVYTTLNVFEIESMKDTVQRITGIEIGDTVPDTIIETAKQIYLVDVPTEELLLKMQGKKARLQGDAALDMEPLYRPGNLLALRELTLRYMAQRVDMQMERYMQAKKIDGPWPVAAKVMVCVSANPLSYQLIREAFRMAASLKSEWIAFHVETPQRQPKSESEKAQIARHLQLAKEMGAEVLSLPGSDVAKEIVSLARKRNVQQIILGKPRHSRLWEWLHGPVVNEVIRNSQGIHVSVVAGDDEPETKVSSPNDHALRSESLQWRNYSIVTLIVSVLTFVIYELSPLFNLVNIALLYLFPVLFSAVRLGRGPSFFAVGLGLVTFDFFFVPPYYSFAVSDLRYLISFGVFFTVASLTASLAARLRQQLKNSKQRETVTSTLYSLSRQMTAMADLPSALETIARQVSETVDSPVAIYMPNRNGELELAVHSGTAFDWVKHDPDAVVVKWVYRHGAMAGRGTETLRENANLYVPLQTENLIHGVLAVLWQAESSVPSNERLRVVEALASLAAVAISRIKLEEEAKVAHVAAESERLRTALFDSISHELRTPLATIMGSVTGLLEGHDVFGPEDRRDLLQTIREGTVRMNRLITNFLEMVRLESGMLRLNKNWCDLEDIIGVALAKLKDTFLLRDVRVTIDERIPPLSVDEVLIEQVLVNILSNAAKYSPEGSEIVISALLQGESVCVKVADEGIGVALTEAERIFEKFYRSDGVKHIPGTGLGLAICKGIVEAHSGKIKAEPNADRGTVITVCLPVATGSEALALSFQSFAE